MKVAIIIDAWFPFIGGGQINAWEIARRIAKKGIQIDIITRDNGKDNLKKIKNLNIFKLGPKSSPNDNLSRIIFLIKSFLFVSKKDYDVIHCHAFLPGLVAKAINLIKGTQTILTVHGTSINTNLNNIFVRFLERIILTQLSYSALITVSRDFLKIKNINKNIVYIPNGVNVDDFDKVRTVKTENPTLIFVGRLHPQKNLPKLLQAMDLVRKDLPNIRLFVVGDGPQKAEIVKLIKGLKLGKTVKMFGQITGKELIQLYKVCHLFILPSIYEGQPLTLLEAWAAKLPVITTKTGDCQFLVKDGINGYFVLDSRSPFSIAKTIRKALANAKLPALGENGYRLVKSKFSWDLAADETLKIYKLLISNKN